MEQETILLDCPPQERRRRMVLRVQALIHGERNLVANLANASAAIRQWIPQTSWSGFYLANGQQELVLGPFQGLPACRRIGWGKGVCGTAAAQKATQLVPDVHAFPGHIACDGGSRSEVVVPILAPDGRVLGVIDLDSYQPAAFSQEDAAALEQVAALLAAGCDWPQD